MQQVDFYLFILIPYLTPLRPVIERPAGAAILRLPLQDSSLSASLCFPRNAFFGSDRFGPVALLLTTHQFEHFRLGSRVGDILARSGVPRRARNLCAALTSASTVR